MDIVSLKKWFLSYRRDLPWREDISPYRVWVSEVMLQQTQVSVVIPYFLRWMERFPTIESLAAAPLEVIIKEWEGLGYYSRARNLHEGAKEIVASFNGSIPEEEAKLRKIKGIGSYTAGAIRSFAFHQKAPAVDGNVMRVFSRFFGIEQDIAKEATKKNIHTLAEKVLPNSEPWIIAESFIELGAKICTKKPLCHQCPLQKGCRAFKENTWDRLPYKATKTSITVLHRLVPVIMHGEYLLLRKGEAGQVMQDLYEFPYFEIKDHENKGSLIERIKEHFCLDSESLGVLDKEKHGFTRYRVHLYPEIFKSKQHRDIAGFQWMRLDELNRIAFSSGHRRVFHAFKRKAKVLV